MSTDEKNNPNKDYQVVSFEPSVDEKRQSRLETLLGTIRPNWKISIIRKKPTWCAGHLETLEIDDPAEDQVDIDYLIRTWGGHKIKLMVHDENGVWIGGGSVLLKTFPPKIRGVELDERTHYGYIPDTQKHLLQPQQYGQNMNQSQPTLDFGRLLDIIQKNAKQNGDITPLLKILEFTMARTQPSQQPVQMGQDMIQQMAGMMTIFRDMKTMFGADFAGDSAGSNDNMMPVISEVVKGLMSQRGEPTRRTGLVQPSLPASPQETPNIQSIHPPQQSESRQQHESRNDRTLQDVATDLARLSPQDAADVVSMAMGYMPNDKQTAAMQYFMKNMQEGDDDYIEDPGQLSNNDNDGQLHPIHPAGYPGKNTR